METERLQIKIFLKSPAVSVLEPRALIAVFHKWIQNHTLDELMIDVADYSLVHQGPGIAMIGHGSDYFLDLGEGRPGLLYSRKRAFDGDFAARLGDGLSRALRACSLIEGDASLAPRFEFDTSELLIRIPDRLAAPNSEATLKSVAPIIERLLTKSFGTAPHLEREGDDRRAFTVRARVSHPRTLAELSIPRD